MSTPPTVVPLMPVTRSQLGKLGDRMASDRKRPEDDALFGAVMEAYDHRRSLFQAVLANTPWSRLNLLGLDDSIPIAVTGRTKSIDTLLDKLRRTPASKLASIRDVAGVRVVAEVTLSQQTWVAAVVKAMFAIMDQVLTSGPEALEDLEPLIQRASALPHIDRRRDPRAGYRAVHVIDTVADIPIEVQVRTELQGMWADLYERFADQAGRDLRYMTDEEMRLHASTADDPDRERCIAALELHRVSLDEVAQVEMVEDAIHLHERGATTPLERVSDEAVSSLREEAATRRRQLRESLTGIAGDIESLLGMVPDHDRNGVNVDDQLPD